jgi:hypothetical protein
MTPPRSKAAKTKQRRNANRKALRKARNLALTTGEPEPDIEPEHAMQHILDRTLHMLRNTEKGVANLKPDEVWRDTMVGKIPNEWIRLEEDLRKEVAQVAGRMIALDIEGRRANAAEAIATLMAPVFEHVFGELGLTGKQKRLAPKAVHSGLKMLEGGSSDS